MCFCKGTTPFIARSPAAIYDKIMRSDIVMHCSFPRVFRRVFIFLLRSCYRFCLRMCLTYSLLNFSPPTSLLDPTSPPRPKTSSRSCARRIQASDYAACRAKVSTSCVSIHFSKILIGQCCFAVECPARSVGRSVTLFTISKTHLAKMWRKNEMYLTHLWPTR